MSTKHELDEMRRSWERHGIAKQFSSVHHFASDKFATKPSGLKGFYNWCRDRDILDENYQTVQRANRVIELIQDGKGVEAAIAQAWRDYPVCKR